jgi:Na+-translocating ferredoxin:NAD+ oxidoreductase subunit B
MEDYIYEKMIEALNRKGGGLPPFRCKEFDALIDEIFTEEEARLFIQMPDDPVSADNMAKQTGMDSTQVEKILERMADNGVLIAMDRGGKPAYLSMSLLPGLYEFHFHKFNKGDQARKSARLFRDYRDAVEKIETAKPGLFPTVPWARVIPLNLDINSKIQINTFDQVRQYIDKAKYIAVANCFCRIMGDLLDTPCDKPMEVCLAFGPGAVYMVERGFARMISRDEALAVLSKANEAGLVHCSSNTSNYIDFLCNCCTCHCYILRTVKNAAIPSFAASSSVQAKIDHENCSGCEACIPRCQMEALSMTEAIAVVDDKRCIGCGLCVPTCPSEAITLITRTDGTIPPAGIKELKENILKDKAVIR